MGLIFFAGVRPVSRGGALRDGLAGVILASTNIPQVLGYTRIAGTPVITGLYTAFLPLLAYTLFGSSRHLVVAADSATAAIFSSSLSHMATPASAHYMALVGVTALLTAAFLLIARIFRLGFLADFLSQTVLVGFLAGVGLQVGVAMLGDMFGLALHARNTLAQVWEISRDLPAANPATLGLAVLVAVAILFGRRLAPRWPISFVAVVGATAASAAFGFAGRGIAVMGPIAGGLSVAGAAAGDLGRDPGAATGRRLLFRDDPGAERRDLPGVRRALSRARRHRRRHPGPRRRQRGRRPQRRLRGQRQPDPDRARRRRRRA